MPIQYSPTSHEYVTPRAFYTKTFTTPKTIRNQRFELSLNIENECIISLSPYVISDNSFLTVKKVNNIVNANSSFTTYTVVSHTPTKANEVYLNRELNYIQLYPTEVDSTKEIVLTFQAKEINILYSAIIATRYDSQGRVIETLEEYLSKCRKALDNVITIGSIDSKVAQIQNEINIMTQVYNLVKNQYPLLIELSNELSTNIPIAQKRANDLQDLITKATDIESKISKSNNYYKIILASDFYYDEDEGMYVYELEHGLASNSIIWRFEDSEGDKIVDFGHKSKTNPKNVYVICNTDKVSITAIGCAGYWQGL